MNKTEVIVALDVANRIELKNALDRLPSEITWFKAGLELFCAEGPEVLSPIKARKARIFLDLKLHDIPRTVEKSVASVAKHQVELLTLHASGGEVMMKAAVDAARHTISDQPLKLLAVTVLTSLDQRDLHRMGIQRTPAEHALELAKSAYECGVDGVVCSLHEAAAIREALGSDALIVTPGIRLPGNDVADQKRVGTPRDAVMAGATHIVVGRPILDAPDPKRAYAAIVEHLYS